MAESPARFVEIAERAAEAAGQVLRRSFRVGLAAELKDDLSPVTAADRAAEQAMRAVLAGCCPGHGVLGEETGLTDPQSEHRWVLDPIDGTRAFLTGRPSFATLIALLISGEPVLGIIDQPITGERWIGCRGFATVFSGGLGRVGTRRGRPLGACELSCTSPAMFSANQGARWQRLAGRTARASYGGDGYAYGLLALGQIDIVAEAGLKVWDWAALAPVVRGAGGSLTGWAGQALAEDGDGCVLALGDPALLPDALQALAD